MKKSGGREPEEDEEAWGWAGAGPRPSLDGRLLCEQAEAWAASQQLLAALWGLGVRLQLPFSCTSSKTEAPSPPWVPVPGRRSPETCPGVAQMPR